jgi:hypothetical protein
MTELDKITMRDEAAFYALHQDLKPYGKIIAEDGYLAGYEKGFDTATTKAREIIKDLKALYFSPIVTNDDVKRQDEILAAAEQFLAGDL